MAEDLISKVSRSVEFKEAFLGKPVQFSDGLNEYHGIVTLVMKEIAKILYVNKRRNKGKSGL